MEKVRVSRNQLSAVLNQNLLKHKADYEEAMAGYYLMQIDNAKAMLDQADRHEDVKIIKTPKPQEHTKDYTRAIAMCEVSVDDVVELEAAAFENLWLDDWPWKETFQATKSFYDSANAARR